MIVLVKRVEGRIRHRRHHHPDSAKANGARSGNGRVLNPARLRGSRKPGDRILFGKYSGAEAKIAGVEYLILREDEILAVLG